MIELWIAVIVIIAGSWYRDYEFRKYKKRVAQHFESTDAANARQHKRLNDHFAKLTLLQNQIAVLKRKMQVLDEETYLKLMKEKLYK